MLAYATAGVLTRKELGRASAGRWSDFGIDETYVLSGLFTWEENFYFRFLKPDDHVLIVGAGSGRDLIGLRRAGYRADGLRRRASRPISTSAGSRPPRSPRSTTSSSSPGTATATSAIAPRASARCAPRAAIWLPAGASSSATP
jgi:hypothetical protein